MFHKSALELLFSSTYPWTPTHEHHKRCTLLYSFALRFLFSSKSRNLLQFLHFVTEHRKGERRKTWSKTIPLSYSLRNPCRILKSENSQDYAQKPQRNCTFMNSASGPRTYGYASSPKKEGITRKYISNLEYHLTMALIWQSITKERS